MTSAARADDNPRPDDAVDVSVIIVTYNGGEHIRRCLEALLGAGRPRASFEVVAVDNASEPSLVPLLREFLDEDSVVRLEENIGFARGCNLGADRARGRHVLLLNPDATVRPGTVDRLVEAADREPRAGVVGGRNMRPDGTNDPRSCGGLPSVWSAVCFATGLSTVFARTVFDPESLGRWERDTERDVPYVIGSLLLSPRTVWQRLGGFDPDYFMYGEDADLGRRAAALGLRVWIVPEAEVEHTVGGSSTSAQKAVLLWRGKMTYTRKSFPPLTATVVRALLLTGVAVRATGLRALGRTGSGWVQAWRHRAQWRDGYPAAVPGSLGARTGALP